MPTDLFVSIHMHVYVYVCVCSLNPAITCLWKTIQNPAGVNLQMQFCSLRDFCFLLLYYC